VNERAKSSIRIQKLDRFGHELRTWSDVKIETEIEWLHAKLQVLEEEHAVRESMNRHSRTVLKAGSKESAKREQVPPPQ
jgi:hypothetical protein